MIEFNNETLILGGIILIGLIILKLLTKFFFRLIGVFILLLIGGGYAYFFTNFFEENSDNKIVQAVENQISFVSVIDYQKTHCMQGEPMSRTDSIMCECIIAPVVDDLKSKFTSTEIEELQKDKKRYTKEIVEALKRNESSILENLKERKAVSVWNTMVRNLKKGVLIGNY